MPSLGSRPSSPQPAARRRSGGAHRRRTLLPLLVGGFVAAALVVPLTPALAGAPQTGAAPRSNLTTGATSATSSPLWGLGVSNSALNPNALQSAMGMTFQAQGEYTTLTGNSYPFSSVQTAANNGARILLNINSWHIVNGKWICYPYSNYPSGMYDGALQAWVDDLQAFNYADTFVTFTHEPTAAHSVVGSSCGTPAQYVTAWEYVYHYFRAHGITYPFIWWMTGSSFRRGDAAQYQPPASDFAVIAVDGYNRNTNGNWETPEFIFPAAHNYAVNLGKPLIVGEIGCQEDGRVPGHKASWKIGRAHV